jgi:hypothetical protein
MAVNYTLRGNMDKHDSNSVDAAKPAQDRRPWETPQLIEYGSVAKLTQSGGSTAKEGNNPRGKKCL